MYTDIYTFKLAYIYIGGLQSNLLVLKRVMISEKWPPYSVAMVL